jgi:hypothetical protein
MVGFSPAPTPMDQLTVFRLGMNEMEGNWKSRGMWNPDIEADCHSSAFCVTIRVPRPEPDRSCQLEKVGWMAGNL